MKISKRLLSISYFINKPCNFIIDIGTDHALLPIYLIKNHFTQKILATDILNSALDQARANLKKYAVANIQLQQVKNWKEFKTSEIIDYILISGLGANTIIKIVQDILHLDFKYLIVQVSNTFFHYQLREFLLNNSFELVQEKIVYENKIFYISALFKRNNIKKTSNQSFLIQGLLSFDELWVNFKTSWINHLNKQLSYPKNPEEKSKITHLIDLINNENI